MKVVPPIPLLAPQSAGIIKKLETIASEEHGSPFAFTELAVCEVPVCDCDVLSLKFESVDQPGNAFTLRLFVTRMQFTIEPNHGKRTKLVAERLKREVAREDQRECFGLLAHGKAKIHDSMDVTHLDLPRKARQLLRAEFSTPGMIPYSHLFPWAPGLTYQNETGETVTVLEDYCCNPDCECKETMLEIASYNGHPFFAKGSEKKARFFYNYEKGVISGTPAECESQQNQDALAELKEKFPSLDNYLDDRHVRIHQFAKSILLDKTLDPPVKGMRNLPCPCGSGKKYKKCCGS